MSPINPDIFTENAPIFLIGHTSSRAPQNAFKMVEGERCAAYELAFRGVDLAAANAAVDRLVDRVVRNNVWERLDVPVTSGAFAGSTVEICIAPPHLSAAMRKCNMTFVTFVM